MRRDGRMPDEGRFLAGIEEAHAQIVVRRVRGEHERGLRMRKLPGHGRKTGVALSVGIQDHGCRIPV